MNINFDIFGEHKPPVMTLHNPNGKQIAIISVYNNLSISPNIGTLTTLTFKVPYDENIKYYKKLRNKRIIKVEGFGQFRISSANDESDGITRYNTITAQSLECELNDIIVTVLEGTYKLWNSVTPSESLLGKILAYLPNWSVSEIDDDLRDISRTFQETTTGAYGFLMGEVSDTYECMFLFDTFNRTIKVKTYNGVISKSDIIVGYSNLVKKLNTEEKSDGIFTCLNVVGANDLSINLVNPLGTSKIYNFKYYMEYRDEDGESIMSDGLIAALTSWNTKFQNALSSYGTLLTSIKNTNKELVVLNGEVTTLEGQYLALEGVYKSKYEQGLDYSATWNQMQSKQAEIDAKKVQVTNKETQLNTLMTQKTTINNNLSLTNTSNFTIEQQKELTLFTIEDSYTDEHFLTTDIMTEDEIQDMAQALYDKAVNVLDRVSQPTYSFSIDMVNFMLLGEYKAFTNQVKLGTMIKLEIEKGRFAYPVLLGYTLNFDKDRCSNVTFDFGSTLLLKSDATNINDLLKGAISSGSKVTLDSSKWSQYNKDKGAVNEFINGTLNASKNQIVNATNQEIKINENGIIGRKYNDDGTYSPEQLWIMNNTMGYTKNAFQTIETAFGKIQLPDGTWSYGLAAQAIMGKLLIGSNLHIQNEKLTFTVDSDGVTIKNGNILMANDVSLEDYIDKKDEVVSNNLSSAITNVYEDMKEMESAIKDGEIVIFYEARQPILTDGKDGDMWYDTSIVNGIPKNEAYLKKNSTWNKIKDAEITKALSDAQSAQTTADGKIRTFYQTTAPDMTQGKDIGDLWVDTDDGNKLHRWNGVSWVSVQDQAIIDVANKLNNVINQETGDIRTDKLIGSISAGKNNIDLVDSINNNAMKLNEKGILIANSKTNGNWNWSTAISGEGIVADYIKANGTITSCNFVGGTLNIGNNTFKVDNLGNCTASSLKLTGGSINVNNQFTVDEYGNAIVSSIDITGGSINIGNNFKVDSSGNVVTAGSLTLGGNINMTGNISWSSSSSPVQVQYSINGSSSWHTQMASADKFAKYSYDGGVTWTQAVKIVGDDGQNGADGSNGSDAFVPEYITETYIDSVEIKSPTISGNVVNSAIFNGGEYRTWKAGVYGGAMDSTGLHVYNGVTPIGDFTYTNTNPNGNANALLIESKNGYAMKISSSDNMSLSANNIYLEGKVIINGTEFTGGGGVAVFG